MSLTRKYQRHKSTRVGGVREHFDTHVATREIGTTNDFHINLWQKSWVTAEIDPREKVSRPRSRSPSPRR